MMSKPKKVVKVVEKPKKEEKKKKDGEKKKKKAPKKSKVLSKEGYVQGQESSSEEESEEKIEFKPTNMVVASTHPKCKFCQAPLRFGIFPVKIPAGYKTFISNCAKLAI